MTEQLYYQVTSYSIHSFYYLCEHPRNKDYVILMNVWTERPERFWKEDFERLFKSREEAVKELIRQHEHAIKYFTNDNKEH